MNRLLTYDELDLIASAIEEACQSLEMLNTLISYVDDEDIKEKMIEYKKQL